MTIPVIDLFAGPGGLGEGFATFFEENEQRPFKITLSIEKDPYAIDTLLLRSFLRNFKKIPDEYYAYLRGKISKMLLFDLYPEAFSRARQEVWHTELGAVDEKLVDSRISTGLKGAKHWVLIGGPPCQAYSTVGRARMRGKDPNLFEQDERHFLYREYLRIVRKHNPSVFVMENVKGILSSTIAGEFIFTKILKDLERKTNNNPGYNIFSFVKQGSRKELEPMDFVIESENYGIPQTRHRVILLGIRKDIPQDHDLLDKCAYIPTVEDAIGDLPVIRSSISKGDNSFEDWLCAISSLSKQNSIFSPDWVKEINNILNKIANQKDLYSHIGDDRFKSTSRNPEQSLWLSQNKDWFIDKNLDGVLNHGSRAHIKADLRRYFFAAIFSHFNHFSPKLKDFPDMLLPEHNNVKHSKKTFGDRFRVQVANKPASTIMSHIAKDGHYYIHPDPSQCRSLTVREVARLQTFSDNYFFEGARTFQYRQVGNAVPPLLAKQLAKVVWKIVNVA